MVKTAFGWNCRACTFHHQVPGNRCSMCGELRGATQQEMADFVLGKRLRPPENGNVVEILSPSPDRNNDGHDSGCVVIVGKETSTGCVHSTNMTTTLGVTATASRNFDAKENAPNGPQSEVADTIGYLHGNLLQASNMTTGAMGDGGQATIFDMQSNGHRGGDNNSNNPLGQEQAEQGLDSKPAALPSGQSSRMDFPLSHTAPLPPGRDSSVPAAASFGSNQGSQAAPNPTFQPGRGRQQHSKPVHPFFEGNIEPKKKSSNSNNHKQFAEPLGPREFQEGPVPLNNELAKTYIYPKHDQYPTREYQVEMTEVALNYNTLVSLPTGLGKTHIAAVVMYNFYRWFAPHGKIIFLAPTLPLVNQQVDACYRIMGIPATDTAVMTGKTGAEKRHQWWTEKRVFYCTPQTVQKDLQARMDEANKTGESSLSAFASQVVCLVLDEAHKASGDYAYTKVIELLNNAGAKYRIVGLSATPGTSIKAIQSVIDALHIVRIAARTEEDESVAPYLHDKKSEIVICKRSPYQKEIERRLSDILGPLLERLRQEGGMPYSGNANLTAFSIHTAKENFVNRGGAATNGYLLTVFTAAHNLIAIRSECHQSLGSVKTKMLRLKNNPQRGELARIVKSKVFEEIYQKVLEATEGDGGDSTGPSKDPKLAELCRILQHHFILSKDAGTSSRAIVFAQFRDSVAEIVDALESFKPMIRSRYFVGQGKSAGGTKKESSEYPRDDRVVGMKQADQQKAIRQFREGVFNVLVCTSIGEEGLDIGEVDVIVNYDVLRSPIRTIQRAGRTGRKRDGRVICLISEGQEYQTYLKRKQAEQTLANALKNPQRFTMKVHRPMLPAPPRRDNQKMDVHSQLHLSQVAGAHKTPKTGKREASNASGTDLSWRLDQGEDEERKQFCRDPEALPPSLTWGAMTKYFLKCCVDASKLPGPKQKRRQSLIKRREPLLGRNSVILSCLDEYGSTNVGGSTKRGYNEISNIFPMTQVREDGAILDSCGSPKIKDVKKQLWSSNQGTKKSEPDFDKSPRKHLKENCIDRGSSSKWQNLENIDVCEAAEGSGDSTHQRDQIDADGAGSHQAQPHAMFSDTHDVLGGGFRIPTPPPSSSSSSDDDSDSDLIPQPVAFQDDPFPVGRNGNSTTNERFSPSNFSRPDGDAAETMDDTVKSEGDIKPLEESNMSVGRESSKERERKRSPSIEEVLPFSSSIGCAKASVVRQNVSSNIEQIGPQRRAKSSSRDFPASLDASQQSEVCLPTRARKRRKMALEESDDDNPIDDSASQAGAQKLSGAIDSTSCSLVDTPEDKIKSASRISGNGLLTDTPMDDDVDLDVLCVVCKYDDSADGNRIVLCDACNGGFHQLCYSIPDEIIDSDSPWFCDMCIHRSNGSPLSSLEAKCAYCSRQGGAMKNTDIGWCHCLCKVFETKIGSSRCAFCSKKRTVQCEKCTEAIHPYCALTNGWTVVLPSSTSKAGPLVYCGNHSTSIDNLSGMRTLPRQSIMHNEKSSKVSKNAAMEGNFSGDKDEESENPEVDRKMVRVRRRREVLARFALEEADIASDQDDEGDSAEEEEARRIEEEEGLSQDSFINDNPELTQHFSQDDLAEIDPDAAMGDDDDGDKFDYSHRALDAQRDAQNLFSTPFLNRRMRRQDSESSSVPASQRGLGRMHFIRSVLEHHRQGGDTDEIERMYQQLEQDGSPGALSIGWEGAHGNNASPAPALSAEQRARIEANRQAALQRRSQHQNGGIGQS